MSTESNITITLGRVEAARRLGIGVRSLDRLVQRKEIPSGIIAGRRKFSITALDRWAEAQCTSQGTA